jgi:dTDP-4-amino-4,6-dideoxygalactose transaminase
MNDPVYVTMPSLAPLEEYTKLLEDVWERGILTHNGPLVQQFEKGICNRLNVKNFVAVTNGTIAIQMAIKALDLKGEIITTPFTWIATISAIQWEGCMPVFCDINPDTLNIDPEKIENLITEKTVAIMPVHVFGNPCDIYEIEKIANKYKLKVIYDAAHAIGSTYKGKSVLEYGDISTTSLHATKLLNTAEGGGCVTEDYELSEKLKRIRFFGHDEEKIVIEEGFNGKMTEIHAALGIANMKYYDNVLDDRKKKYDYYKNGLSELGRISFQNNSVGEVNYSYFPVIFQSESDLLRVQNNLNKKNIFPRRYFYPSVNTFTNIITYSECFISEDVARRIMCLPLYFSLEYADMDKVIAVINRL